MTKPRQLLRLTPVQVAWRQKIDYSQKNSEKLPNASSKFIVK